MMVQYSFHPDGPLLCYTKEFAYSPEHHSCIWQHGKPNPFACRSLWQEHDAAGSSPFSLRLSVCDHFKTAVFSMHLGRDITVADAAPTHAVCRGPTRQSTHDKENSRRVDESILLRRIGPLAKALDFAIHKRRMSGTVVLLNRWIVHTFPQLYPVKMVFLRCRQCNITIIHHISSIREYGSCFWCDD